MPVNYSLECETSTSRDVLTTDTAATGADGGADGAGCRAVADFARTSTEGAFFEADEGALW